VSNSVTRLSLCCYVDTTNSAQAATVLAATLESEDKSRFSDRHSICHLAIVVLRDL
jgi:hypothetical protein